MTDSPSLTIYRNVAAWRGCEKLFLDARTADFFFVFETDDERIPAHKAILSAISPVFDAMFYDSLKFESDEYIIDSKPEAFREFLQFFCLSSVKLTAKNVVEVLSLAKQYMIDECFNACNDLCESTLTLDTMCWGYELAIVSESDRMQKYCEKQIGENAEQIFRSSSFLDCKSNLLRRILQLDSLKCSETVVFDGCIAWAKMARTQMGLNDENVQNLRFQLDNMFYDIRFGEMTSKEFYLRYRKYDGLFSAEEFKDIIGMIEFREFQPPMFNRNPRKAALKPMVELVCDRIDWKKSSHMIGYPLRQCEFTVFESNCPLLLKSIHCSEVFYIGNPVPLLPIGLKVIEIPKQNHTENVLYFRQLAMIPKDVTTIELSTPISIEPNKKYGIMVQFRMWTTSCHNLLVHKPDVEIANGVVITFHNYENRFGYDYKSFGLVTRLDFGHRQE